MKLFLFCLTTFFAALTLTVSAEKIRIQADLLVVTTFDNVKGKWQRKEDGLHIWDLNVDGTYSQVYNDEKQVSGKWGIYTDTKENGGKPDANGSFLWLTAADGQVYCYKIEEMSGTVLKLKNQTILYEFTKM